MNPEKTNPILKNNKYLNPYLFDTKRKWFHYLLWQIGYYDDPMPPPKMPKGFRYPNPPEEIQTNLPTVTWINHCSFLVIIDGITILTDPIWSRRCSPIPLLGPKRKHYPPISLNDLPPIDVVLISHNHYDHLDLPTIKKLYKLNPQIQWMIPRGLKEWFHKKGITRTTELSWWESQDLELGETQPKLRVTSVPSQHFSGRGILDLNKTLWCGFVLDIFREKKQDKRFYFVGDTGYNPQLFEEIGKAFGEIDLSLIPIGTYVPNRFMGPVHIDPDSAVAIHKHVKSRLSVGMHWYTFRLSDESRLQPMYDLYLSMKQANMNPETFRALLPGQMINW